MAAMTEFDRFSLEADGDRHEQRFWKLLAADFPAYQLFWRMYVVPLTNRVDFSIDRSDRRWIRMRPAVSDRYLRMAMDHYSVFYFVGRATEQPKRSSMPKMCCIFWIRLATTSSIF